MARGTNDLLDATSVNACFCSCIGDYIANKAVLYQVRNCA